MTSRETLLLVDDEPTNLTVINEFLRRDYCTRVATDGRRALALAGHRSRPDLIVLDVGMPGMDGYEVCARLKSDPATADIPVIFLSAHRRTDDVTRGLDLGAVDFIAKPVALPILRARVRNHLRQRASRQMLAEQNRKLGQRVSETTQALQERTDEVARIRTFTTAALGALAETRDNETANHNVRTQAYVKSLVDALVSGPYYRKHRTDYDWREIWLTAPLHDIGKVGIPDSVLQKPGKLTSAEFEIMKQHTQIGHAALHKAQCRANVSDAQVRVASEIAYCHHERWNGQGYPQGLAGEAIPVSARLVAVADVYDALISKRIYKAPLPHDEAIEIIRSGHGSQFDPAVVDCLLGLQDEFREIAGRFGDAGP